MGEARSRIAILIGTLSFVLIHLALLIFCARINLYRGVPLDEARFIPAGLCHWRHGEFTLASDSPPLARMIAALPLLPLEVAIGCHGPGHDVVGAGSDARQRELAYGGWFASDRGNPRWFMLFCLARMTGFAWWLLGAWVIARWSAGLFGWAAGFYGVALWCLLPNVLAHEHRATPALPLAVACLAATYAFRGYLIAPSWAKALRAGLLLGVAQLVEFAALILLVIWPLLALSRLLTARSGGGTPPPARRRTALLHTAFMIAASLGVINLGYAFRGTGSTLGSFDFPSRAFGESRPPGEDLGGRVINNHSHSRGTWLGWIPSPVPADYAKGLDRRWYEWEDALHSRDDEGLSAGAEGRSLATAEGWMPLGFWGAMLWSLILVIRHCPGRGWAEESILWLPVGTVLVMTMSARGFLSPAVGTLLATPFAIVLASKLARHVGPGWRKSWVAVALTLWIAAGSLSTIYAYQFTPEHRARFLRDLDHLGSKLGLTAVDPAIVPGAAGHGLQYHTFVDSRGVASRYALFVPRKYHGEHPYPLILFLHGYGDAGTAGRQFTAVGLPFTLEYRDIDFLVLCPQGHRGTWDPDGDDARRAMELLAAVQEAYRVDSERVYLTGLSTGGSGVWDLAARFPDRWAALVPVASAPCDTSQAARIEHIPCWCFHSRYDGGSPADRPRQMIKALRAAGGSPRYTEFIDVNHNAWDRAYHMPELYDWLARQRLPRTPASGPGRP